MQRPFTRIVLGHLILVCAAAASAAPAKSGNWASEREAHGFPNVYVYEPAAKPRAGKQRALMLVLHGCKQTAKGDILDNRAGWEKVAEQHGMVLAAPDVPDANPSGTRLFAGCWDWFGNQHQRGERDIGLLAKLITALQQRDSLKIDPAQTYVVGLSSGAAVAQLLACSYPELVAGAGLHSAPAMGSLVMQVMGPPQVGAEAIAAACKAYAGEYKASLDTQIVSLLHGSEDRLINPLHAPRNLEGFQLLYGANAEAGKITEANGSNGKLYKDDKGRIRAALIMVDGLGHAFSAGDGGSGGGTYGTMFHDYSHVNYPAWVSRYFFENNLRVKR